MKKLLILGAGGYGKTIADVARQMDCYDKIAFLDDGKQGPDILGRCEEYTMFCDDRTEVYPAFGNNEARMNWLNRLLEEEIPVPTLVHPSAYVSPCAVLGEGTVVLPMAVVNTGVTVEAGCIINIGALIDHDCVIEAGVHLCPGVIVKAENRIASGEKIESGEVILARIYPV
ncbi:MAG: hypothetical protein IJB59_13025 [Oscillospiraceae bacterium]|nr:hypothetical protein [Oscillospiraceae bacterium]